ncbi:MAG: SusC/RagA family TonB-linked outer membrane protein [Cytophagales bacterium]|nr:SusC/RagA family TonB-linked outer membrane protein [Cytophagales bacterium]
MEKKLLRQIVMVGKRTIYGFLAQLIFLNLLWAHPGNAQVNRILSVKDYQIEIRFQNAKLIDVFKQIEQKTGYHFAYDAERLDRDFVLNKRYRSKEVVADVLMDIARATGLKFKQINKTIIVVPQDDKPSVETLEIVIDGIRITGKVTSSEDGQGLPGVNVMVKGTSLGTVTDVDGNYSLEVPGEESVLVFSSVGYVREEITVGTQTVIAISMVPDITALEEIVVVGYGRQEKVNLTGAISSVRTEDLISVTTTDLRTSMVGKLPGLRVMQRGGEPGSYDSYIDIRGWGAPLVIVDGVPRGDFQKIDPNTIASITILKDASAAVYGVRAANGVILIESKEGQEGKTEISFTSIYGIQKMTEFPKPIDNSIDNLILKNEAALAAGHPIPYPDYLEYDGSDPLKPSINYWDLTMRKSSPQTQNVVNASGGSKKIKYFLSFGHMYDMGLFKSDNLYYNRYNIKSNITAQIIDNLSAQMIITGLSDKKRRPYGSTSWDFFKQVWMQPPYEPVYYWDPELGGYDEVKYFDGQADRNPVAVIDPDVAGYRDIANKQIELTTSLTYNVPLIEGLSLKGLFAYDVRIKTEKQWRKGYKEYKASGAFVRPQGSTRLRHSMNEWLYPNLQFSANYRNTFGNHNFTGLLLYEQRTGSGNGFMAGRYFALDVLDQLNSGNTTDQQASGIEKVPGAGVDAANRAIIGRLNYDLSSKYLMELSFRYDGSSNFAEEDRWGFFPAASLGWRISEESFIKDNISGMDNLKLRVSHGVLGDHSAAGGFQYIEGYSYPSGGYLFSGDSWTTGSEYRGLANPHITWYTATTSNVGMDVSFWNNLLGAQVDLFQRRREGLLANRAIQIPGTFGTSLPLENLESDQSRGFEIELSHFNKIGQVRYWVKGTFSFTRTKWLHREATPAGNSYAQWRHRSDDRWKNIRWGYGYTGQFQTEEEIRNYQIVQLNNGHDRMYPGDIKYLDWNEDGMIDGKDEHPIGRGNDPEVFFSFNVGAEWKGLAIHAFFQGASRYDIKNSEQLQGPLPWGRNSSQIFLDRWHHEDPLDFSTPWVPGKYPISRDGFGYGPNKKTSPFWLHDVTYLRLKNVEISYTLPSSWTNRIGLEHVRIFTNGLNLYTWSDIKELKDPEQPLDGSGADNGYKYPLMANYSFGINVTF